eukprot:NODE_5354_length_583_cov_11.923221_g4641_i0.p2 GENE.NODE_5354_length_583_cov_11.923221_g4641_i0~~NODE_5354_length_583_cov_11.923221_g4641_i0.p2  ORF type:complete len:151 (+),score=49.00 NODE_5354_length_583_cov_11.923221_g4641_i0:27-455(+)
MGEKKRQLAQLQDSFVCKVGAINEGVVSGLSLFTDENLESLISSKKGLEPVAQGLKTPPLKPMEEDVEAQGRKVEAEKEALAKLEATQSQVQENREMAKKLSRECDELEQSYGRLQSEADRLEAEMGKMSCSRCQGLLGAVE